jgi:hypothetical protein
VVDRAFGRPLPEEEHASGPLAGGIMAHGYQCGQVWGSALGRRSAGVPRVRATA